MFKKLSLIQTMVCLFASLSFSAVPNKVIIIGTVKNIFTDTVTIQTKTGVIKVPRSTVTNPNSLREGMTARAELTFGQLLEAKK